MVDEHPVGCAPVGSAHRERPFDRLIVLRMGHHIFGKPVLVLASDPAAALVPPVPPDAGAVFDCVECFTEIHVVFPKYAPAPNHRRNKGFGKSPGRLGGAAMLTLCGDLQPDGNERFSEAVIVARPAQVVEHSHVVRVEPFEPG